MADGGVVTQEGPKVKWTEDKALTTTDQQQLERLLSVKLTSFPATDPPQHYATLSVEQLLEERDEMWREHGRSLCAFMEREQGRFLRVLHQEIEQLQRKCGDVTMELAEALTIAEAAGNVQTGNSAQPRVKSTPSTIDQLRSELNSAQEELAALRQATGQKDEQIGIKERQCNEQENRLREELERRNKKIKEITAERNQKSSVITQVMTQLHQLRLREAVEKQKRQLGDQQSRRRQLMLNASKSTPAYSWLHSDDGRNSVQLVGPHPQVHRPGTAHAAVRSSILPPIFGSPLIPSSSMVTNIEKPEATGSSKSFRSSFRQPGSNRSEP